MTSIIRPKTKVRPRTNRHNKTNEWTLLNACTCGVVMSTSLLPVLGSGRLRSNEIKQTALGNAKPSFFFFFSSRCHRPMCQDEANLCHFGELQHHLSSLDPVFYADRPTDSVCLERTSGNEWKPPFISFRQWDSARKFPSKSEISSPFSFLIYRTRLWMRVLTNH